MNRSLWAALAVIAVAGLVAWLRRSEPATNSAAHLVANGAADLSPSLAGIETDVARGVANALPSSSPQHASSPSSASSPEADETSLMGRLRRADPVTMLALAREGDRRYPGSAQAEEREARAIDALVALDDIGEAHTEAMLFVQHHPSGPFTTHIVNLMGVHPRPPGAVPEPGVPAAR